MSALWKCLALAGTMLAASPSAAAALDDPRIGEEHYDPGAVYTIAISPGKASVVELQKGEAVESIVVGDVQNWLVEPTASADRVVIKPSAGADTTNMVVITTRRTYTFILDAHGGLDLFVLRFSYDNAAEPAQASYRFHGDRDLFPRLMSDNGRTTSIYWPKSTPFPAVFVVDRQSKRVAADFRAAGDGLVIDGVFSRYVFRLGKDEATAIRRASGKG